MTKPKSRAASLTGSPQRQIWQFDKAAGETQFGASIRTQSKLNKSDTVDFAKSHQRPARKIHPRPKRDRLDPYTLLKFQFGAKQPRGIGARARTAAALKAIWASAWSWAGKFFRNNSHWRGAWAAGARDSNRAKHAKVCACTRVSQSRLVGAKLGGVGRVVSIHPVDGERGWETQTLESKWCAACCRLSSAAGWLYGVVSWHSWFNSLSTPAQVLLERANCVCVCSP